MNENNVIRFERAKRRKDVAALAIIEGGRRFVDDGPDRTVIRFPQTKPLVVLPWTPRPAA